MNEVRITKAEIWRTAEAIKQAGCRDVLIVSTPEHVPLYRNGKASQTSLGIHL